MPTCKLNLPIPCPQLVRCIAGSVPAYVRTLKPAPPPLCLPPGLCPLTSGEDVRSRVRAYLRTDGSDIAHDFIRACMMSVARTCVVPMQVGVILTQFLGLRGDT